VSLGSSWFVVKLPVSIPQPFLLEFNPFLLSISKIDSESAYSFVGMKKKKEIRHNSLKMVSYTGISRVSLRRH
jgi:hypothetical protein